MRGRSSAGSKWVDGWGAAAWFLTAGLWLAAIAVTGEQPLAHAVSGMDLGDPSVQMALGGVTATFLCLLETYPSIADRRPILAQGGLAASGFSAAMNPILYGVVMLSLRRPDIWELPGADAFGQLVGFLWMAGMVIYPLGTTLYGAAVLRIDDSPNTIGYLLFVPLVAWAGLGLTILVDSAAVDPVGSIVVPLLLAGSFLAIGSLRFTE